MTLTYKIEFFTYWHVGSGLSGSTYADSIVRKTDENLPFIPGKTLKGLIRDAAFVLESAGGFVSSDFIDDVFGERSPDSDAETQYLRKPGCCFFSNATLSKTLQKGVTVEDTPYLYKVIASTKIDKNGVAEKGSLRQEEVTIPMTLFAQIHDFPEDNEDYLNQLNYCLKYIKRIGLKRTRGLGRCKFQILK